MNLGVFGSLLRSNHGVRRMWLAETLAAFGTYFFDVAVMWYVFAESGSGLDTGLVAAAAFVPMVVLGPWFGALADRRHRRQLMVLANVAAAALAGGLAATVWRGGRALWPVYAITAVMGAAGALYNPARAGIFPEIVRREDLMAANALFHTSRQAARVAGSALGGIVMVAAGAAAAMSADVLALSLAAALVAGVHYVHTPPPAAGLAVGARRSSAKQELGEAWRWMRQRPVLLAISGIGMVSNVALGPTNVLAPMLIRQDFHAPASALGLFDAAIGAGIIAGGLLIGMLALDRVGWSFALALALEGLGLTLVAVSAALGAADLGNVLLGIGLVSANAPGATMIQTIVPSTLRGRVSSLSTMMSGFAIPITYGGVGLVGDAIGAHGSYGLAALLMAGCVVAALAVRGIRNFRLSDSRPPAAAGG